MHTLYTHGYMHTCVYTHHTQTIAATDQVTTSDVFQDFLKSAVESKRIQGVNLPQEKFSRKRSQRVTSRGRSKDTERGSEVTFCPV